MDTNKKLLEINNKIDNLKNELFKLEREKFKLKTDLIYSVGQCFNRGNYYYKTLSINKKDRIIEAICITYEDEEYGIAYLPFLGFNYVNEGSLISSELFEKLYKEVMSKISK